METTLPLKLKVLLASLAEAPGQIEEEVKALLCRVPTTAPSVLAVSAPAEGTVQAESELKSLLRQIEQANCDLILCHREIEQAKVKQDEQANDLGECEDAIEKAHAQYTQLLGKVEDEKLKLQSCEDKMREMDHDRVHFQNEVYRFEVAQSAFQQRANVLAASEEQFARREQIISEQVEKFENTRRWLESLLPAWLSEASTAPWKDALLEDVQQPPPSSTAAGLLFASFSFYIYAQRDSDARSVVDALREVGRRLFAWLKERNMGDYEATTIARIMADHINNECTGRCEVEVPVPGSPAQNLTMLYQPRPGVSAQSVLSVQSWCVRGAKREVIHRATVTV